MESNHEKKLADKLESLGWQYADAKEYSVEVFFNSGSFFKFVKDLQELKNEYSFVLHVNYDTTGNTFVTFERIWYFGK